MKNPSKLKANAKYVAKTVGAGAAMGVAGGALGAAGGLVGGPIGSKAGLGAGIGGVYGALEGARKTANQKRKAEIAEADKRKADRDKKISELTDDITSRSAATISAFREKQNPTSEDYRKLNQELSALNKERKRVIKDFDKSTKEKVGDKVSQAKQHSESGNHTNTNKKLANSKGWTPSSYSNKDASEIFGDHAKTYIKTNKNTYENWRSLITETTPVMSRRFQNSKRKP